MYNFRSIHNPGHWFFNIADERSKNRDEGEVKGVSRKNWRRPGVKRGPDNCSHFLDFRPTFLHGVVWGNEELSPGKKSLSVFEVTMQTPVSHLFLLRFEAPRLQPCFYYSRVRPTPSFIVRSICTTSSPSHLVLFPLVQMCRNVKKFKKKKLLAMSWEWKFPRMTNNDLKLRLFIYYFILSFKKMQNYRVHCELQFLTKY